MRRCLNDTKGGLPYSDFKVSIVENGKINLLGDDAAQSGKDFVPAWKTPTVTSDTGLAYSSRDFPRHAGRCSPEPPKGQ